MTEKLYYHDAYKREFSTKIWYQKKDQTGRWYVVLERTIFYPTGGGQPHDTGVINGVSITDVEEVEGEIRHYVETPLDLQSECYGSIDWDRRFDHMQQHAGQHMLSAAFEDIYNYKTVGFHLGQDICSIDLETSDLLNHEVNYVEDIVNDLILENRVIESKWITEEEIMNYSLRKELSVKDNIRLVIIPQFDYNGCGGTHPTSTGQVNSLKVLHWEKQKKQIRVYFICGKRVLKQLGEKHQTMLRLTNDLSAPQDQLSDAVAKVLQNKKDLEKTIEDYRSKLIEYEVNLLVEQASIYQDL
ncbi:alanyl-tRNA editing protein [Aquibacillus koreensis]|uniref:Alanyl-tRNA editing protein n=1 Tax=Aquibacillus koreensis TaxID=279446 RepID=A0A9X3WQS0_9BACI|nr:alanyl-tRNA editing protein [Aquibacillus koreensis]MCT2536948.1 alanyl-tRNA editing protein [Aquibacillus koreensis]MDC3421921.1 alanyl-tRNA editing protein [Aquibacillus koreensis]